MLASLSMFLLWRSFRFDCVYPTRTARFGVALVNDPSVPGGTMRLKNKIYNRDMSPVDSQCECSTCKLYTRAYLHTAFRESSALASQLLTIHNVAFMMRLMRTMRQVRSCGIVSSPYILHKPIMPSTIDSQVMSTTNKLILGLFTAVLIFPYSPYLPLTFPLWYPFSTLPILFSVCVQSILEGSASFESFVRVFLTRHFPSGEAPLWVHQALREADIDIADLMKISANPTGNQDKL